MSNPRFQHPADLIAHVQRSHGTPPGPPPDQYAPPAPTPAEPWSTLAPGPPPAVGSIAQLTQDEPSPTPPPAPVQPRRPEPSPSTSPVDGVVFEDEPLAYFMGYKVDLNLGEVEDLRQVLARAVMRMLEEQKAKVRQAIPNKRRK